MVVCAPLKRVKINVESSFEQIMMGPRPQCELPGFKVIGFDLHLPRNTLYLLSPRLCFFIVKRDLFVYRDDSLTN